MPLPTSGQISLNDIKNELTLSANYNVNFSIASAENLLYTGLNTLSISSSNNEPNIYTPDAANEWHGYSHNFTINSLPNTSVSLSAPYNYVYPTFAQYNMGTTSGTSSFTASAFLLTGSGYPDYPPNSDISYSVYNATYPNISSGNLLKSGILSTTNPSGEFNFEYNGNPIVTFVFGKIATIPPPLFKYDIYSSSYSGGSTLSNLGTLGSSYDLTKAGTIGLGGAGNGSYVIMNTGSVAGKFNGDAVNLQQSQWAMSMYVMPKAWKGYMFEIDADTLAGAYVSLNNQQQIEGTTGGGSYQVYRSFGSASLDRWYHIVFQKDYSNEYLYINGQNVGSNDSYIIGTLSDWKMCIGGGTRYGVNWLTSSMYFGSLSVWTGSVLNAGQIDALYSEFTIRYLSVS